MPDGAHMGVDAQRALETILGGKHSPSKNEKLTRNQVRSRLFKAPEPLGAAPRSYGEAADAIARAMLLYLSEHPQDPVDTSLYDKLGKKWPGFDKWLGGATGFMVGWATNCVRWLMGRPAVPNPAIVEIATNRSDRTPSERPPRSTEGKR